MKVKLLLALQVIKFKPCVLKVYLQIKETFLMEFLSSNLQYLKIIEDFSMKVGIRKICICNPPRPCSLFKLLSRDPLNNKNMQIRVAQ